MKFFFIATLLTSCVLFSYCNSEVKYDIKQSLVLYRRSCAPCHAEIGNNTLYMPTLDSMKRMKKQQLEKALKKAFSDTLHQRLNVFVSFKTIDTLTYFIEKYDGIINF